ncbi:MAG: M56 family metallopeptidase [Clostridia bacterium]|nr:M56 family metallopeptidase [Clostridia bacterium]
MAEYLVLLLAQVTIFSSVTAVLLLAVRCLFRRRIPPMLSMILWLFLFIRVTVPVLPESSLSIYNLFQTGRVISYNLTHDFALDSENASQETEPAENPYQFQAAVSDEDTVSVFHAEENKTAEQNQNRTELPVHLEVLRHRVCVALLTIYCGGVILTGIIQLMIYDRAIRRVYRSSSLCEDPAILQVYTETAAKLRILDKKAPPLRLGSTTMLAGLFRPCVILCPENTSSPEEPIPDSELRMIFGHELNHFKHGDNWILVMGTVVCTFFWFHPLLWLVRKMFREDVEILCDARTLENTGVEEREYARMLCRSSHLPEMAPEAGAGMSASGRNLKLRLLHISSRRNRIFLPKLISVPLCGVMVALCLTNPLVSADNAYEPYIERIAAMTGESVRDITLDEQVTVQQFLYQTGRVLAYVGDEALSRSAGGGDLDAMLQLAEKSPYVSSEMVEALRQLSPDAELTIENCALLLSCLTDLVGEGRYVKNTSILPEMLSAETMENICRNLTEEEAELFLACYNLGVEGADVKFSYVYTEAMMKLILSRVQDSWSREKLAVYYQKINLSAENLDEINAYLDNTVRVVGINRDFYICDPAISRQEEETLRNILGAAFAGEREDIYYLKKTEDGCSFALAAEILERAGMSRRDICAEYTLLGETTYVYTPAEQLGGTDDYFWISAFQLNEYAAQMPENEQIAALLEACTYHETFTYTKADGSEDTISMRYYTADPEKTEECRKILTALCDRLNAVSFIMIRDTAEMHITDAKYPATEEACRLAMNLGLLYLGDQPFSVQEQITSGQCA